MSEATAEIREPSRPLAEWSGRKRVGVVRATRQGVFVDGTLEVPAAEIGEVFYVESGDEHILHLRDAQRRPRMDLVVPDVEVATALLAPLSATRRTRFAVDVKGSPRSSTSTLVLATLAAIWMTGSVLWPRGIASAALFLLIPILAVVIAFALLTRNWLELGSDGLLVTTRGRKRFVRYDAVSDVEAVDATKLRVRMVEGAPLELTVSDRGRPEMSGPSAARDALLVHCRAALSATKSRASSDRPSIR